MRGIIDDLRGGFTIESFVGHTNEVTILNVIREMRIIFRPIDVSVITRVLRLEEGLDLAHGHRIIIRHHFVGHNVSSGKFREVGRGRIFRRSEDGVRAEGESKRRRERGEMTENSTRRSCELRFRGS